MHEERRPFLLLCQTWTQGTQSNAHLHVPEPQSPDGLSHLSGRTPPPWGSLERPGLRDETSFLPYWEVCIPGWAKRVCFGWSVNWYLFYSFILIHDRNRSGTVSEIEMLRCVTLFFGISFTKIMIESYIMSKLYKTSNNILGGQYVRRPCKCIYIESNEPYLLTPFSGPLKLINNHHYWYYNEYT